MRMPTHRFRRESHHEFAARRLAATIKDQRMLDGVLAQMNPKLRDACRARLIPYLKFRPAEQSSLTPKEARPA